VRHAAPRSVHLTVTTDAASAVLLVVDDGEGFDVPAAESRRDGMGLFTMRERMGLVEGTLEITSQAGAGTLLRATVPIHPDPPAPA
jgi:signal transduction histidine kinase